MCFSELFRKKKNPVPMALLVLEQKQEQKEVTKGDVWKDVETNKYYKVHAITKLQLLTNSQPNFVECIVCQETQNDGPKIFSVCLLQDFWQSKFVKLEALVVVVVASPSDEVAEVAQQESDDEWQLTSSKTD